MRIGETLQPIIAAGTSRLTGKWWRVDAIGVGACIVVTGLAYLLGVAPVMDQAKQTGQQRQAFLDQQRQANALRASYDSINRQIQQIQRALDREGFRLKPAIQMNQHLADLTELATQAGLSLHGIQPGQAVRGEHYGSVPITISGIGSYPSCAKMLHGLHQKFPDTRVTRLGLSVSSSTRTPTAKFDLSLVWYTALDADNPDR